MARKAEEGLRYFPINSDIVTNPKIRLVVLEFGPKAWAVLLPLLCKIYRERGYYLEWNDEDVRLLFANEECRCDMSFVNEVVLGSVKRGLFDKSVFDRFKVLTSDRIQENYLEGRARSKDVKIWKDFTLIDINVYNNAINVDGNPFNADINSQRKEKKRKVKESSGADAPPTLDEVNFKKFQDWLTANAPNVTKLKQPFTLEEFVKVRSEYPIYQIQDALQQMHNWKPLLQKRVSAYLTFLNWIKSDFKESKPSPNNELSYREKEGKALLDAIER